MCKVCSGVCGGVAREAAVVLQCNYSLSAAAGGYSPALLTLSLWAAWLRRQIDHS